MGGLEDEELGAEASDSERDSVLKSVARSQRKKKTSRNNDGASMVQYTRDLVRVTEQDDYDNSSSGRDSYDDDRSRSRYDQKPIYKDSRRSSGSDFDSRNESSTKWKKPNRRRSSSSRSRSQSRSRSPSNRSDSWFSESDHSSDRGKRKPKQVAPSAANKKSKVTQ